MSSRFFVIVVLFIAMPTLALPRQQSAQFGNGKFQADRIDTEGSLVRLRGSVRLTSADVMLEADEVEFDSRSAGKLEARGNVSIRPNPELRRRLDDKSRSLERLLADGRYTPRTPEVMAIRAAIAELESRILRVEAWSMEGSPLKIQIGRMLNLGPAAGKEQFLMLLEETGSSR
jgi:hypothetical protein